VPLILGDTVHNIRCSLDYFAYAVVPSDRTMFPVVRSGEVPNRAGLRSLVDDRMKGAPAPLRRALIDLQPYRGGTGEFVWLVNYLDIVDKHRLLLTTGMAYEAFIFDAAARLRGLTEWTKDLPVTSLGLRPAEGYTVRNGTPLFTAEVEFFEEQKEQLKFRFGVAFSEPPAIAGKPVLSTLREFVDKVEDLLQRLIPLAG
jgi:hypothetical protein